MRQLYITIVILLIASQAFSQAAGNYINNQRKAGKSYGGSLSGGDYYMESANQPYFQTSSNLGYSPTYWSTSNDTVIVIRTNVLLNKKADSYQAILGVSQVCDSIEKGHNLINKRIERYLASLEKLGIKKSDIFIDFISQVPVFEYEVEKKMFTKSYNEIPKGFELKKNIHINYSDPALADQILMAAAKNEIYDIIKVDYIISDLNSVYQTLRDSAIAITNDKINDYKKLGVKFTPIYQTVSENINSFYPIEKYDSYGTFNYASLGAVNKGDSKIIPNPNESVSLYYNKQSYKPFDMVINPVMQSPCIQFVLTLETRIILKKQ